MKKSVKKIVTTMIMIVLTGNVFGQDHPKPIFYMNISGTPVSGFSWGASSLSFSNLPLTIRDVPIHPYDTYASPSNGGPINVSSLDDAKLWWLPNLFIQGGIQFSQMEIEAGGLLQVKLSSQNPTERNYTNAPGTNYNGIGAALTYIKLDNSFNVIYGLSANVRRKISSLGGKEYLYLSGSFIKDWQNYAIETGWDRYAQLQSKEKYPIGKFSRTSLLVGPEVRGDAWYISFFMGYSWFNISSLSNWGEQMKILTPQSLSIKIEIGLKFDTRYQKKG